MRKKCLLLMVAALFSWAGFAQINLLSMFDNFENEESEWDLSGNTIAQDGDAWEITFSAGWNTVKINFGIGEIAEYNTVLIEYEAGSGVVVGFVSGSEETGNWWYNQKDEVPSGTNYLLVGNQTTQISIMSTGTAGTLRITKLELFGSAPIWPEYFENPINFQNPELRLNENDIPRVIEGAPFATASAEVWPASDNWSATFDKEEENDNVFLKVKGRDNQQVCIFKVNLESEGKTFGDIEKISFKYKFDDSVETEDGWYGNNVVAVVNKVGLDNSTEVYTSLNFANYPAVYYSWEEEGQFDEGYSGWATITIETAWFDAEGGEFDNARFSLGDGYAPSLESIAEDAEFWLGIGINTYGNYYMDDVTFTYKCTDCTSVENVTALSVKVYSNAGVLYIQGAESATIYGIDGSLIATAKGQIALPKGVYIVKAGNEVVKAIVK